MLDLRLLHQALTLARHRNFARAAAALHMTQPALSRSIAGLESSLGEKLFSRTQQGVEPTSFGRMLLSRGQDLLAAATEVERDFNLMRGLEIGELHVGAGAYAAEISVGQAAGRLASRHPGLRMEMTVADLRALAAAVIDRRLDLAVIELSLLDGEPRIATEALPRHPGYFYCRAGHPLLLERASSVERILAFPFVGTRMPPRVADSFLKISREGAIDPDTGDYLPPIKVDSVRLAKDIVRLSDAVGAAPLSMLAAEIESGQLVALPSRLPWMTTAYGFVYLRDRMLSPAAEAFMTEVRRVEAEELVRSKDLTALFERQRQRKSRSGRPDAT